MAEAAVAEPERRQRPRRRRAALRIAASERSSPLSRGGPRGPPRLCSRGEGWLRGLGTRCNSVIVEIDTALTTWLDSRLPPSWCSLRPEVMVDGEEALVTLSLGIPSGETGAAGDRVAAVRRFREESRDERVRIAREVERRFGRRLSWGARCGEIHEVFTTLSVPVMTRLRIRERLVLDALVASGVARTRSDALAWCVRLVGEHEAEWIRELRDALVHVERVRARGPLPRK